MSLVREYIVVCNEVFRNVGRHNSLEKYDLRLKNVNIGQFRTFRLLSCQCRRAKTAMVSIVAERGSGSRAAPSPRAKDRGRFVWPATLKTRRRGRTSIRKLDELLVRKSRDLNKLVD